MTQKIVLDNKEYDIERLSDESRARLSSLQFTDARMQELINIQALLQRAKNSYIESLKKEILTYKSGFLFDQD